jgi:hypothetical protein
MKDQSLKQFRKRSRWFLAFGIAIVVASPFFLLQPIAASLFSGKGDIGNAIGGITAPFVGFIGAILVYLSFEQQIEANQIQREALRNQIFQEQVKNEYDTLEKHLTEIKDEFYNLRYRRGVLDYQPNPPLKEKIYTGRDALEAYSADIKKYGYTIYPDTLEFEYGVRYLMLLVNAFEEQLETSIIRREQKNYLAKKFLYFYEAKIKLQLELINRHGEESGGKDDVFATINEETNILMKKMKEMFSRYKVNGFLK